MVVSQRHNTGGGGGGNGKQVARTRATSSGAEQEMKKAVNSLVRKGKVQAYVVLALNQDNDITVTTSRGIQHTVQPLMRDWASSHLRRAHEFSGFVEETMDEKPNVHSPMGSSEASSIDEAITFTPSQTSDCGSQYQKVLKALICDGVRAWNPPPVFQIDDTVNVTKTLLLGFLRLLQNMCKRLAKEWIKGICPRKQAKFPYRDSVRERNGETVPVPVWWPSEKISIFREPDHVDKMHRIAMCVHFLRLRPTVAQMTEWNSNATKKQPLKTHTEGCWTEFLKELAPVAIADEVASTNEGSKAHHWRKLLEKIYEIAALEEQYQNGEIDGSTMVSGLDDMKKSSRRPGKRSRQVPAASESDDEGTSESDANLQEGPIAKKAKTAASRAKAGSKAKYLATPQEKALVANPPVLDDRKPVSQAGDRAIQMAGQLGSGMRSMSLPPASSAPTPLQTSFDSSLSDISACDHPAFTPASPYSDFGGGYPHHGLLHMPNGIQCHNAHDIPQPQFATMPNTPTFGPNGMMPFEQHPAPGHDMAGLSIDQPMASPQFVAPAPVHQHHGLPTGRPQYHMQPQWAEPSIPQPQQPLCYEVQHGVPSAYTQHAGFAVGFSDSIGPHEPLTTYHAPPPHFHGEHDMGHSPFVFGPSHEIPPGTLPASVERGYTGHSSGVGDSACPPGYASFFG